MQIKKIDPPRPFKVGRDGHITLFDCAHLHPQTDEQITLKTESGTEFDVLRKDWGYYATPSLNGRLPGFGLRAALIKSPDGKYYLWLVERGKEDVCMQYLKAENLKLVYWLDTTEQLEKLEAFADRTEAAGACP